MQLTTVSWVWWGIGVAMIASVVVMLSILGVRKYANKHTSKNVALGAFIWSVAGVFLGALLVLAITAGGVQASAMQHDLDTQGYQVVDIQTTGHTATVMVSGYPQVVQLEKSGDMWRPYLACPVSPEGTIDTHLRVCTARSGDGQS